MTVTQKRAYWVLPPSVKEVPYAPLSHINFLGRSGSLTALRSLSHFSRRQSYQNFLETSFLVRQKKFISVLPSLCDEPGPSTSTAAESYCYCWGPERDDMIYSL